ncbi:MAG: hypothetical protein V3V00_10890 [Saprospiraceae bacterium]
MKLSFNKGDYGQHMNMVNATKELLNDSIVLRSIMENVDHRIAHLRNENARKKELIYILLLAIPLAILIIYVNYSHGFTWRIISGVALAGYFFVYHLFTKDTDFDSHLSISSIHDEDPKPLKFLQMKVDYLTSVGVNQKTKLELTRAFYFIFFPFICYFTYESVFKITPFTYIILGLATAVTISLIAWYFFFKEDFKALSYSQNQLKDYNKLIHQHYLSISDEEE